MTKHAEQAGDGTGTRVAVVTGANQGLGRALVAGLASRLDPGDLVLLAGRDQGRVADAVAEVRADPGTRASVVGRLLDVRDPAAITALATELAADHGGVDIMISNASARIRPDRSQAAQADEFIDVANVATHTVLRAFGAVLRPGGRLIVVASALGRLGFLDPRLHPLFDGVSLDDVEKAVESWRTALRAGTAEDEGWPRWLNIPSKVGQVAAVRAAAAERREADLGAGRLLVSVCPGLFDTAASRPWFDDFSEAQTAEQAARAVLDLALDPTVDPAYYGELVQFGTVLPWYGGTLDLPQNRGLLP